LHAHTLHIRLLLFKLPAEHRHKACLDSVNPDFGSIAGKLAHDSNTPPSYLGSSVDSGVTPRIHRSVAIVKCKQTRHELHLAPARAVDDGGVASAGSESDECTATPAGGADVAVGPSMRMVAQAGRDADQPATRHRGRSSRRPPRSGPLRSTGPPAARRSPRRPRSKVSGVPATRPRGPGRRFGSIACGHCWAAKAVSQIPGKSRQELP
jgi:hypothetical protein